MHATVAGKALAVTRWEPGDHGGSCAVNRTRFWGTRQLSRRAALRAGAVTGVGIASAALIGCSSSGSKTSSTGANTPAAGTSGGTTPVVSDGIVMIQNRDVQSLDPLASQVFITPERIGLVYPKLFYYNRKPDAGQGDVTLEPSYATTSWEFAGDGSKLTFKMRQGVKYSNIAPLNGRELVAEDVKFSFDRYMNDPNSTFKALYSDVKSIETPDRQTVVFNLKKPSRYVLYALAGGPSFITPPEIGKAEGDYKAKAIGPGPYIFEGGSQGEGARFKKNPDFIDGSKVYYNRWDFKVVTDQSTGIAAIKTGQADYGVAGLTAPQLKSELGPSIKSFVAPATGHTGLWFNMRNPKWADLRARTAVSKAIDRQAIIDQQYFGDGVWGGPVPVDFGKWAFSEKELKEFNAFKYDPAEAKKLWAAAGKPATSTLDLYVWAKNIAPASVVLSEFQAGYLQKNLGITTQYSSDEYSTMFNKLVTNKFDDVGQGGGILFDWLDHLIQKYSTGGARNGAGLSDPKVDAMLDDLRSTVDDKAAQEKAHAVSRHLIDNVLSMADTPNGRTSSIYNSKLQNFLPAVRPPGIEWVLQSWKAK